jgi:hypothetical protein
LSGPFHDTLFKLLIEPLDFGLGSLEGGGFDNVPTPVSPCEDKLVCTHHIQDLRSSARRKRVRAQHGEALIARAYRSGDSPGLRLPYTSIYLFLSHHLAGGVPP